MKRKNDDSKKAKTAWSASEDDALLKAVLEDQQDRDAGGDDEEDWDDIAKSVPGKTPVQCLKRYIALNKKQGNSSSSAATTSTVASPAASKQGGEDDEDEDDDASPASKKLKASKKDAEGSGKWTQDEIELLKKLVEQYKDSKYLFLWFSLRSSGLLSNPAFIQLSPKVHPVGTRLQTIFQIKLQLIA